MFDCDGVILDSNRIKTEAFEYAARIYGSEAAEDLVAYHLDNGGVSRHKKFRWLLDKYAPQATDKEYRDLINCYAQRVYNKLLSCNVALRLKELRAQTSDSQWIVISGGEQKELRDIFEQRGLAKMFDGGIFGSPTDKINHLERLISGGMKPEDCLFVGDSLYDLKCAKSFAIDSIFVSKWSDVNTKIVLNKYPGTPIFESITELSTYLSERSRLNATGNSEHGRA